MHGLAFACNLSPQGDGNSVPTCICDSSLRLQFIPARGRKPISPEKIGRIVNIAIYPRKGTETRHPRIYQPRQCIAIYPRKGTETCPNIRIYLDSLLAIYPRKGTETWREQRKGAARLLQFIPARGRKPGILAVSFQHGNCNLSPRGDKKTLSSSKCWYIINIWNSFQKLAAVSPHGR